MTSPTLPPPPAPGAPSLPEPVPTLPPPTSPTVPAHLALETPPPAAPAALETTPAAPANGVPTLPAPSAAPSGQPPTIPAPQPAPGTAATEQNAAFWDDRQLSTPPTHHDRGGSGRGRVVLAVIAVAALGGGAFWMFGRSDDTTTANDAASEEAASAAQIDGGDASIGQIAVDAITDTNDVADAINADQGEAELLAELGLGPTGEPIVEAQANAGHQFSWTFADGMSATIVVDTVSGDHSYVDGTGLEFRQVGELSFARSAPDEPWTQVDGSELAGVQRIGLDRPITTDDLVGGPVAAHRTVSGDGSFWSIDDPAFEQADPAARAAWIAALGLPDTAADGPVTIWVSVAADGITVSTASIERPATGETVSYELSRVFAAPPVIDSPEL